MKAPFVSPYVAESLARAEAAPEPTPLRRVAGLVFDALYGPASEITNPRVIGPVARMTAIIDGRRFVVAVLEEPAP